MIFQKSLIESAEQRAASQYITAFRAPGFEKLVEAKGFDWFFDTTFACHVDVTKIPESEKRQYIADWSQPGAFNAMLNWYRAVESDRPAARCNGAAAGFPAARLSGREGADLVIWGMKDEALLPLQLEGLDTLVDDLTIVRLPDAGHFAPWEAGGEVAAALQPFLAGQPAASAPAQ